MIADHAWRDRDAAGHLDALAEVSGAIDRWVGAHRGRLDSRLEHYLTGASFDKALAFLESGRAPGCGK